MLRKGSIGEVHQLYDAFIIDIWGVIHDGVQIYPGVVDCIKELMARQKTIIFLSNAPRPYHVVLQKLNEFGLPVKPEMVLTSGDLTRKFLETYPFPIYHLGANRNQDILAGLKVQVTEHLKEASLLLLTAYLDEGELMNQYDSLLQEAANLHLPAVCANPDKLVKNGDKNRYCAGLLAEKYTAMGGSVQYFGKPYIETYDNIFSNLKRINIIDKKRILMIGDTLETDIAGAKAAGIDSALVLTGNMHTMLLKNIKPNLSSEEYLTALFETENIQPSWILPGLLW